MGIALVAGVLCLAVARTAAALDAATEQELGQRVAAIEPQLIAWRRDIHQHPELSGQEARTAALVAAHLQRLGLAVTTGVGGTGVVGVLVGAHPGKVVALRADMDALPVTEMVDLPFASRATGVNMGKETGVMHACGHDGHTAMLMAVAEVLAGMKSRLHGTVKFIFQPAEEGYSRPPRVADEHIGARAMIDAGVLENPQVDAIFGLHLVASLPAGVIGYRSGPLMASGDAFTLKVTGRQTHGAMPWNGVDPIVAAAQIILGLQTIVSRQVNIAAQPAVLSIGSIHGGNRENIIPDSVDMLGTLRTYDDGMRDDMVSRMRATSRVDRARQRRHGRTGLRTDALSDDGQRRRADGADAADAVTGGARQHPRSAEGHGLRGFLRVPEARARDVLLHARLDRAGHRSGAPRRPTIRPCSAWTRAACRSGCARWRRWRWITAEP